MRCPSLLELPPAAERSGWRWTEDSPSLPDTLPDGRLWPRVNITTPSFNHDRFAQEAIRSILPQDSAGLEYIIFDSRSTENTLRIMRQYSPWLAYWESEPDCGLIFFH